MRAKVKFESYSAIALNLRTGEIDNVVASTTTMSDAIDMIENSDQERDPILVMSITRTDRWKP